MALIEKLLTYLASFQKKYAVVLLALVLIATIVIGMGLGNVRMQTDFSKELPQGLDIFKLNNKIKDKFGGQDIVMVLLSLDEEQNSKGSYDAIRAPLTMQYLIELENALSTESAVESVVSAATFLKDKPMYTTEQVKFWIKNTPAAQGFFSKDFKHTVMYVTVDVGESEAKTIALSKLMEDKQGSLSYPPGVSVSITGNPPIRVIIFSLLRSDAISTIILASIIILILLFIIQRSFIKGILIFVPLVLGLIWTMGTMGWIDMPLSVATVGIGAMILGLGVEYGVFMLTRYYEERDKGESVEESLKVAVPAIGSAILGSGLTTISGFLALTLSIMPMLQKLGISLALGIFFCLVGAVFILPVVIVVKEQLIELVDQLKTSKIKGVKQ